MCFTVIENYMRNKITWQYDIFGSLETDKMEIDTYSDDGCHSLKLEMEFLRINSIWL